MRSRYLSIVVVCCILVGLLVCQRQRAIRQRFEQSGAELQSRRSTLEAEAKRLGLHLLENKKTLEDLKQKAAVATTPSGGNASGAIMNVQQRLDDDPRIQVLNGKVRRNGIRFNYGPFFRARNLSPAQAAEFEKALLRSDDDQNDAMAVMRAKGLPQNDPALGALVGKAVQEYQNTQTQLLGEDGYKALLEYERTMSIREVLGGIAASATVKGIPFPASQAEKLVQLMAPTSESYQKGGWATVEQVDWEVIDAQAEQFLTPEQLWAFKSLPSIGYYYTSSRALSRLNASINKAAEADRAAGNSAKATGG